MEQKQEKDQSKNICRPITFINDYMPIRGENNDKPEFCAFGIVDGIEVGNAFALDGVGAGITNRIWEDQKIFKGSLKGKYNAQRIYIVRWEEEEAERTFWEGDALPFFFFCRVQCDGDKLSLMKDRKEWESRRQNDGIAIKTYLTYDNTDLFIVIRAEEFSQGAKEIDRLHKETNFVVQGSNKCILKNSFTVMAVRYSWINTVTVSERQKWNQNTIENVYIRLIEREGGDIEQIEHKIKADIPGVACRKRPVLGTDDEMIVLSNIGWGDFLLLYDEKKGVFGNRYDKGSVYNSNAAGVTTQICVPLDDDKKEKLLFLNTDNKNEIFNRKTADLKRKLNKINTEACSINELNIILNALLKYSGEMFNDYVFFPLLKVLDTLLDLMIRNKERLGGRLDKAPFYDFLKGFCFYTQHTTLTDRHTAQIMGFNVKIYDIPVKLNALYNALLYRLVSVLQKQNSDNDQNEQGITYDFIAMPGAASFVNVVELYKDASNEKRLMKVEIPESSFYDVYGIMIILSHEAAHYVGRMMRSRSERTDAVVLSYAQVYLEYIEKARLLNAYGRELWAENKERLVNMIYRVVYRRLRNREQELQKNHRDDIDYFIKLRPMLYVVTIEIIGSELSTVFAPILCQEKEEVKRRELLDKIQETSWRFVVGSSIDNATVVSSQGTLDALIKLYEESFADLMSIMVLQMRLEDYIAGIINCAEYQGIDVITLQETEACLRISAVLGCVLDFRISSNEQGKRLPDNQIRNKWIQELAELEEVEYEDMPSWQKMVRAALLPWYRRLHPDDYPREYEDNVYSAMIYNNAILENVKEYLNLCMNKFSDNSKDEDFEKKVEEIRKLFKRFDKHEAYSGEDQIRMMVEFIEDYRTDLLNDMT